MKTNVNSCQFFQFNNILTSAKTFGLVAQILMIFNSNKLEYLDNLTICVSKLKTYYTAYKVNFKYFSST